MHKSGLMSHTVLLSACLWDRTGRGKGCFPHLSADRGCRALEVKWSLSEPPWRVGPAGLALGPVCFSLQPRAGFSRPRVNGEPGDPGQISDFSGCLDFPTSGDDVSKAVDSTVKGELWDRSLAIARGHGQRCQMGRADRRGRQRRGRGVGGRRKHLLILSVNELHAQSLHG